MGELFIGRWTIDLSASTVWDDRRQAHVPDEVGQEVITIREHDGVQDYEVLYGDQPVVRMGYAARWDDPAWTPYLVREIVSTAADARQAVESFRTRVKATEGDAERRFAVGEAYGLVRLVSVDAMTHYRLMINPRTRAAQAAMLRRMEPDRRAYMATVLDTRGIVHRRRRFVRV